MPVTKFRPFKVPKESEAPSFSTVNINDLQGYMEVDLAASGLLPEDLHAYVHSKAVPQGVKRSYVIPYFGTDGQPLVDDGGYVSMWRKKVDPPIDKSKYYQPAASELARHELPRFMPYILPQSISLKGDTLYICEGEKKTACFMKYTQRPAIGIGGCRMWHDPDGSGGAHPWIMEVIRTQGYEKVVLIPDGDLWQYDICKSYGDLARALENNDIEVTIVDMPDKVDDLFVRWGVESTTNFDELTQLEPDALFESPASLMNRYNLPFREVGKDRNKVLEQHSGTITILMQEHPAFPEVWRNQDDQLVYMGEDAVVPDTTEMLVANHMQINFGMNQVKHQLVRACMMSEAGKNQKSPFLDWIKEQNWDGVPRLESWMQEHWGVEDNEFTREIGLKWLVSACARLDKPGVKVDWMLVATGGQGTGKTSMPALLFRGNDIIMNGDHNDKDFKQMLHAGLCVIVDELDSFGKKEASFWKSILTTTADRFRAPYAASVSENKRRCILYGTANTREFLTNDTSGYRRYPTVEPTKKLDFEWFKDNVSQLWAEAWKRYNDGDVEYWEIENASENAEQYVVENPLVTEVEEFLAAFDGEHFRMIQLLRYLDRERDARNMSLVKELGNILRSLDWVRKKKRIDKTLKWVWTASSDTGKD